MANLSDLVAFALTVINADPTKSLKFAILSNSQHKSRQIAEPQKRQYTSTEEVFRLLILSFIFRT